MLEKLEFSLLSGSHVKLMLQPGLCYKQNHNLRLHYNNDKSIFLWKHNLQAQTKLMERHNNLWNANTTMQENWRREGWAARSGQVDVNKQINVIELWQTMWSESMCHSAVNSIHVQNSCIMRFKPLCVDITRCHMVFPYAKERYVV